MDTSTDKNEDDDNDDSTMNYHQGRFFGAMHILALEILCHALDTKMYYSQHPTEMNHGVDIDLSTTFWNHALRAMMYNIHSISHH
jgi:hypothetical protein